ncbi:hypothetical protein DY000_02052061 [Brassica cretica]|uniref:Cation-transporting P-type ATPase C-terminal domain-containing protein n=1 Tax=Brassica cretica TaxID=69181 RepID=A0ABQ7ABY4_BRACR|nr:hypothetical protein DY000_02052061 [Brassica cretica]
MFTDFPFMARLVHPACPEGCTEVLASVSDPMMDFYLSYFTKTWVLELSKDLFHNSTQLGSADHPIVQSVRVNHPTGRVDHPDHLRVNASFLLHRCVTSGNRSSLLRCQTCESYQAKIKHPGSIIGPSATLCVTVHSISSPSSRIESISFLTGQSDRSLGRIIDCRTSGIRVMVITGDNKSTAEAICREIGVFKENEDISSRSLTGKEFMDVQDQKNHLRQTGGLLFSRAEPKHKQEIVRLLKEDGEVVAMTGDGVNDAPALELADIGVAMGIAGTEVAKEASDMVLADDNFSTIVAAVGEGTSIYNNMKAFVRRFFYCYSYWYMISSNIGEVASIFLTAALGIPEGMIPVQLLWVNLVTDGPPATTLGFNPPEKDIMKKPPRRSDDSLITPWILFCYMVIGMYVGVATVGVFIIWYTHCSFMGIDLSQDGHSLVSYSQLAHWGQCFSWEGFKVSPFTAGTHTFSFDTNPCEYFHQGKIKASTLPLSVLVAIEMFNSLNALSEDGSLVMMPLWVNPWLLLAMVVSFGLHFVILPFLAQVFGIVPLSLNEWPLVLVVSLPVILIDEVLKFVGRLTSGYRYSPRIPSAKQKAE